MAFNKTEEGNLARVTLREARADDEAFLYELYASTRAEEMAAWGLSGAQQEMLLNMQFKAQQAHYEAGYADAEHKIILVEGVPAGRIMVLRLEKEITLVDISLLTEHRRAGIGTYLINALLDEARVAGLPVTLHVYKGNPAIRLYDRLGFTVIADAGAYLKMECRPHD
jgi:ribosomal protein S18 acetylase RimI-like enzyme